MATKTKTTKQTAASRFTDDELQIIGRAALRIWNEIGYDVLCAVGDETSGATVSRDEVVEMVLDAGRLERQLRADAALLARVEDDLYRQRTSEIERYLTRDVFRHARYGY